MLRVLVVDDNTHMTSILRTVLNSFGIRNVDEVRGAVEALELIRTRSYDFVLLDYNMPILDGIELTRLIRTGRDHNQQMIPIIMITGFTERSRVISARDAGVTEVCVKPVTARDLWNRIAEIINAPRPFVRSKNYTGPDRRRHKDVEFSGKERRQAREQAAGISA
ncbi:response regulator receiver [Glycocaulis alkaliphilus]|uniref:Response regulator receiver n=1 Tax=Glycocaulis alkaliphilus TaxID=1434191 RepID=A0A3T0E9W0_9PROT|nr:response regulator [Glycocaulis alkaliphilus]AZU04062.1 response regulator receiver [Glycocaulis alkaliphilus]